MNLEPLFVLLSMGLGLFGIIELQVGLTMLGSYLGCHMVFLNDLSLGHTTSSTNLSTSMSRPAVFIDTSLWLIGSKTYPI